VCFSKEITMRTQPEIESEIEYFKAFAKAASTRMEYLEKRIDQLEIVVGKYGGL
jgi:transcription antitermination factor NusA-like protein